MTAKAQALEHGRSQTKMRLLAFVELTKPRLVFMILITTFAGYYLGSLNSLDWLRILHTLVGTGLAAAGVLALNQHVERDLDARMERTRNRPLPDGRLTPTDALIFGTGLTAGGLVYLVFFVNLLSCLVVATIVVSYLFIYTPLKQKSSFCTVVGAVPGALPPVVGWVAARGHFSMEAGVLFGILFLWQMPHSLSIACLYRDDYAQAGFQLLPVVYPDGDSTRRQILTNCAALLVVGLMPTLVGLSGILYFFVALTLGAGLLACGIYLAISQTPLAAKRLLYASLIYLPMLFLTMAFDRVGL